MLRLICTLLIVFSVGHLQANELESDQRQFFEQIQTALIKGTELPNLAAYPQCYDKTLACQTAREIFVQAADELLFEEKVDSRIIEAVLDVEIQRDIPIFDYINILLTFKDSLPELWMKNKNNFHRKIQLARLFRELDQRSLDYLESHEQVTTSDWNDRYDVAKALLTEEPPIQTYWDGRYYQKPRIYMFCRDNRKQKCLMLMKDAAGNLIDWSQESLGHSRHRKDFHQTNGNTPSGVWRIDSVMPSADQQRVFGKFRRLIINFVGHSQDEINIKKLLPTMTHNHSWWHEGVVARNNGRGLFRIHGTGLRSSRFRSYFPLVPTAGCVAQSENTYNKIIYRDQRLLLDQLMVASGLDPIYENETEILGLLYVIDIDKKEEPVTIESLKEVGIL